MRILHTADWHLGKLLEGKSRIKEQEEFCQDLIDIVRRENIDMVIIAGDVFDGPNPPAKAESLFYETIKAISYEGKVLTVIISGNHDSPERLASAKALAKTHGIIIIALPTSIVEEGKYGNNTVTKSGEGYFKVKLNESNENAVVVALPYPSEKRLNEVVFDLEEQEGSKAEAYARRIKEFFHKGSEAFDENSVNIAISHLFTMGVTETGSERNIELGGSYIVDSNVLPKEAQYTALGHVHKHQKVPNTKGKAYYCGAPIHYNKREIAHEKSVILVDIKAGKEAEVTTIPLRNYKPIRICKVNNASEAIKFCQEYGQESSWAYIEITSDKTIADTDIKLMKEYKADIVEIIVKTQGEREYEQEIPLEEKSFEALFTDFYFSEKNIMPSEELMKLLKEIIKE